MLTETAVIFKYGYFFCCCVCWNTVRALPTGASRPLTHRAAGQVEKTVPLEKITDLQLTRSCLDNLFGIDTIQVQTASTGAQVAEMVLRGVENARDFRAAILAAKRARSDGKVRRRLRAAQRPCYDAPNTPAMHASP